MPAVIDPANLDAAPGVAIACGGKVGICGRADEAPGHVFVNNEDKSEIRSHRQQGTETRPDRWPIALSRQTQRVGDRGYCPSSVIVFFVGDNQKMAIVDSTTGKVANHRGNWQKSRWLRIRSETGRGR